MVVRRRMEPHRVLPDRREAGKTAGQKGFSANVVIRLMPGKTAGQTPYDARRVSNGEDFGEDRARLRLHLPTESETP